MSKHIAFIPLRKGSKGIPGKNKKKLLGRPLFCWVLSEAIFSKIDQIYVYTDDEEIKNFVLNEYDNSRVFVIDRNPNDAIDSASTEAAMSNFCESIKFQFETITLLQATSPLTTIANIDESLKIINSGSSDSVLSLVLEKRFIWDKNGKSRNYDIRNRPRRQDFEGLLIENGAIYTTTQKQFKSSGIRIGGRIAYVLMSSESYIELDEEWDFPVIEELLKNRLIENKCIPGRILALILDVDGVFTDGKVTFNKEGEFSKTFNMRDGMGLEILRENGVIPIVLTSENTDVIKKRMEKLGINNVHYGTKDKFHKLTEVLSELKISHSQVAYLGDDRNDLANILRCGWGICPYDAISEVLSNCDIRLNAKGGNLAIREASSFILKYNKRFK